MQYQQPNSRLIKIQLLRLDLVLVWVKTEGKEEEKKGRKRERETLRGVEIKKTLGRIKDNGEVWKYKEQSLFVVAYLSIYLFFITLYIYPESSL